MLVVTLLASILAAASPSPSPSPTPSALPAIGSVTVVSGSPQSLHRAAQPVSVIDGDLLSQGTAFSLDQALRVLPGIDRDRSNAPFTNYGQLRLSFSGTGQDRGALFVDGIPAQDGFGGQVDWSAYPAAGIARGELLRGPGSALYGSGAIGGVLSLLTTPPSRTPGGQLDAATGGIVVGDGTFSMTGAAGAFANALTLSSDRLSYSVTPPGLTAPQDRPGISTADVFHLRSRVALSSDSTLDLDALAGDDAQQDGLPNYGFSRAIRQAAATWTQSTADVVSVTAFVRATTVVNLADKTATPGALLYTQHVPTSDAGVRERWEIPDGIGAFTFVADERLVTGESDQNAANGTVQSDVAGTQKLGGVALQQTWSGRFGGIAGARYDAIETDALGARFAAAISPRLDLRYEASKATVFRAAFGTGLRAPYLNELIRSYRIGSVLEESNPHLVPERSRSFQVGTDIAPSDLTHLAVDYTGTRVFDAIGLQTIANNVQQQTNYGQTATDTFTADYEHRLAACTRLRGFAVTNHDRVVMGPAAEIGKRLAYVPDAAASISAEQTVRALTGAIEVSYLGPTFADDLQKEPLGNTMLIGGRLTLRDADGTSISLAVDNLADRVYLSSIDRLGPPSSVTLRLSVPVGPRYASARPAACG
jgi:outer membrane receptor protein involved in Fe transport